MTNERKEWEEVMELKGDAKVYFSIPESIIMNKDLGKKRIAATSYFLIRKGLDDKVLLSLNSLSQWYGREPNRHSNGINGRFKSTIEKLKEYNYLSYDDKLENKGCIEIVFNTEKYTEECNDKYTRFAVIYLDELKKIVEYTNLKDKEVSISDDTLLLVFSYLRMKIYRRRNKLSVSDTSVEQRKLDNPEVYNAYYSDVANELGVTLQTLMLSIDTLESLGLVYTETLPREKKIDANQQEKWVTNQTLFCNTYKRERNYMLAIGKQYYEDEIDCKKIKLRELQKSKMNVQVKGGE